MCATSIAAVFIATFDFHVVVPPTSLFVQAFLVLFFSKLYTNFAGRFQQDSAAFITTMSNLLSCFLSGIGPLKHLFLLVSSSLVIIH